MNLLQLICSDNFIAVNKTLVKELGIEPALLLGELASEAVYWNSQEKTEDGYFYSTIENVEERTTLTAYQQRKHLALLQEKGLIDVVSKKGSPPKRYIKIYEDALLQIFNFQNLKNLTFESEKTLDLNVKKLNIKNKEGKKNREEEYIHIVKEITGYSSLEFISALSDFVLMRKNLRKPLTTERAFTLLAKKTVELSNGDEGIAVQLFNQSIANSWLSIYPLKNSNTYRNGNNEFINMLKTEGGNNDTAGDYTDIGFATFGIPEHTD